MSVRCCTGARNGYADELRPLGVPQIPKGNNFYGVVGVLFRTSPKQNSNPNSFPDTLKKEQTFCIMKGHQGEHREPRK